MRVLVTGGTGFLGHHTVAYLLRSGHSVRLLGRAMGPVADLVRAGAEPIVADLRDAGAIAHACMGMDAVIHLAAKSEPWGRAADFTAINVGGTAHVINGCRAHGVQRLVYCSSPSVVFTGNAIVMATEDAPYPTRWLSIYAATKKRGEDLVNAANTSLETVILRPKAIFGPGDRALLPRLIAAARRGRLPQIGAGTNQVDLTYVENVAAAFAHALSAPQVVGKTYTLTNDAHPQLWEVIRQVLHALHLPAPRVRIPLRTALVLAGMLEAGARVTGQEPLLTRYTVAILAQTQTYDITAARRDLDYRPHIALEEGIARTLAALEVPQ